VRSESGCERISAGDDASEMMMKMKNGDDEKIDGSARLDDDEADCW
jgi:hypothetical protein